MTSDVGSESHAHFTQHMMCTDPTNTIESVESTLATDIFDPADIIHARFAVVALRATGEHVDDHTTMTRTCATTTATAK